jgi:HK97 family phage major capsid protein
MSDIEEVKGLFAETQKVAQAAKDKADEISAKSADFVLNDEAKRIKDDLAQKFTALEAANVALKTRLEAVETKAARPAGGIGGKDDPELKSLSDFMRTGVMPAMEGKAMQTGSGEDGGFLVPMVIREGIQARQRRATFMRQIANVVAFQGEQYSIIVDRGDTGFEWGGEITAPNDTATPTVNRISLSLHPLSAMPKASQKMLDNVTFDIAGWLEGKIVDRFIRAEGSAYVSGSGVDRPKGFLSYTYATGADDSRASEALQYRATGVSGGFAALPASADVLVKTFYDLQAAYQVNATWLMKNTTLAEVAVIKDENGTYLLRQILNDTGSFVQTIMGRPVMQADDMPVIAASSLSIVVGDFSAGYTIVENPQIRMLRDPFSSKPNVLFYATKQVGGGVTDFDAIKAIKFAVS